MKTIETSKGQVLVDDALFELIKGVPICWNGDYPCVRLHHMACIPRPGEVVDHINRNRLDARAENLRSCTPSQNGMNKSKANIKASSKYIGVSFNKQTNKYRIRVAVMSDNDSKDLYDAKFNSEVEAAIARDICAIALHGEFAALNFPISNYARIDVLKEANKWKKFKLKNNGKNTSKYRGVVKRIKENKYEEITASIKHKKKMFFLGSFSSEEEAARAYDAKAIELKGNRAILNFISKT